jgi:RNA recognition motif-containing protein
MPNKLFVGNLPHSITDAVLSDMVTLAGFRVTSAVVVRNKTSGSPRGFGFVQLAQGENIQRGVGGLNGLPLAGRPLAVFELLGGESRLLLRERLQVQRLKHQ